MTTETKETIKASELRIGSRVFRCNDLGEWENVIVLPGMIVDCSEFQDLYRPIPLAPELLEKCGFFSPGNRNFIHNDTGYVLNFVNNEWRLSTRGEMGFSCWVASCKYLHQLQNLYFALTGEELEIKL